MSERRCGTCREPITMTCLRCQGKGCDACQQRGWFFIPLPIPGAAIRIILS